MVEQRKHKQEQETAGEDITEVAPGVLRMQLPIEMPGLGHVNTYGLVDERGVAIVDPGLPGDESWSALETRLASADLRLGDVHTVLVTHSHPDHFGAAGRLAQDAGAGLVTHSAFRTWMTQCDHEIHDVDPEDLEQYDWEQGTTPWGGEGFRGRTMRDEDIFKTFVPPQPTQRVRDGDVLRLAGRDWFAVHTPGHTLDHLCLHDPEGGVVLSGDHVLPSITPHISGVSAGRDPLAHFFASLDRMAELEGVTRVLPAHGHPFDDLAGRCKEIKDHHADRMDKLRSASAALGVATVMDLSRELFQERSWGPMAESETFAHLEHLRLRGEAERRDEDGLILYEVASI